jgi:TonB family protein
VVTTPAIARAFFWLGSLGLHAAAFVAAGHGTAAPSGAQRAIADDRAIEISPELVSAPDAPASSSAVSQSSLAARPTHMHSYPVAPDHDAHPHDPSLVHVPFIAPRVPAMVTAAAPPAPEVVADSPSSAPARFTMVVANASTAIAANRDADGRTAMMAEAAEGSDAAPLSEDGVSSPARLAASITPAYPSSARAQEIEADVVLAIVVARSGGVIDARVVRGAGWGFDEEALRAVRAAKFVPAQHDGHPVAVRMRWSMSFRFR